MIGAGVNPVYFSKCLCRHFPESKPNPCESQMTLKRKKLASKSESTGLPDKSVPIISKLDSPLDAAIARGVIVKKTLAGAEGGFLSCAETARLLAISQVSVIRRWRTHRLIGWEEGGDMHFPFWQFHKGKLLPGIEEVLRIFRSDDQWRVMLYFLTNRHSLAMQRPLDLLRRGESDKVVGHATTHLEEHNW